jgi:hypothetical protein
VEQGVVCTSTGNRVGKAIIEVEFEFSVGIPTFVVAFTKQRHRLPLGSLSASGDKV